MATTNVTTVSEIINEAQASSVKQANSIEMMKELREARKVERISKTMKVQIMERTENGYTIIETSRKFGLVKENREIKKSNVYGFLQIIHNGKYDETQPIVTAEANELIANYNLVDLEGNAITTQEAKDYLIVLDGQHRITAFAKLNASKTSANQIVIPNIHIKRDVKVREYLADINLIGRNWTSADKICVASISNNNPLLDKVNELIKENYNMSTAVLICTGMRLKPNQIRDIIRNGDTSMLPDSTTALARANKFLTTAYSIIGNNVKLLTKRYYIQGFNSYAASTTEEQAFEALDSLLPSDFDNIYEGDDFAKRLAAITV